MVVSATFDMGLMCDIRIVAGSAKFSEIYINVDIVPGDGATYFLPSLFGVD